MRLSPQVRHLSEQQIMRGLGDGTLFYDLESKTIVPAISGAAQCLV
jgi:hypothetical protein